MLLALSAETIDFSQVPPHAHDGRLPRERMIAGARAERAILRDAIADSTSTHTYTVDSDSIIEVYHQRGTLDDGDEIDLPVTITYEVRDGVITGMRAEFDAERAAAVNELLRAARPAERSNDES